MFLRARPQYARERTAAPATVSPRPGRTPQTGAPRPAIRARDRILMDQQTLLLAVVIAVGIWAGMRVLRQQRERQRPPAPPPQSLPSAERGTMPRIGEPHTMTPRQIRALKDNEFVFDRSWSREEAALVLDTVAYLRAACRRVTGSAGEPPPLEVQNELLRIILTDRELREHVRQWGMARRDDAGAGYIEATADELPVSHQSGRIAAEARRLLRLD